MTLADLSRVVRKPDGGRYSLSYLSRIERGWCNVSFFVYLAISEAFEIPPGRLLGPDDAQREISQAEATLVDVVRRLDLSPAEAIARLSAG